MDYFSFSKDINKRISFHSSETDPSDGNYFEFLSLFFDMKISTSSTDTEKMSFG